MFSDAAMNAIGLMGRLMSHLLLPVRCASCEQPLRGDPVPFFCRGCWAAIKPLRGPVCPRCGRPFHSPSSLAHSPDHQCGDCRLDPPAFSRAWSSWVYEPPLTDAIRLLKYHGKVGLAAYLGDLMEPIPSVCSAIDLVMPVPLFPARLREREFNQSLLLADRLNRRLRRPLSYDNLVRVRATPPQTELPRSARLQNLRQAFAAARPHDVAERRILLIDDVYTTGTTLNECAKTLRKAGAAEVYAWTLARAV
jgi:ComF family protein